MEIIVLEGGSKDSAWALTADVCSDKRDFECEVKVTFYSVSAMRPRTCVAACERRDAAAYAANAARRLLREMGIPLPEGRRDSLDVMCKVAVNRRTRS